MKLVIDCFKLIKGNGKSIGIFNLTKNLISHISTNNSNSKLFDEIVVLGTPLNKEDFHSKNITFVSVPYNPLNKLTCIMWELFYIKKYIKHYPNSRILFPRGFAPLFFKGNDTILVHDLIPFFYKENYPGVLNTFENLYIRKRLLSSIKHANSIITISEYSRQDIVTRVPSAESKISVIYNGLNDLPINLPKPSNADPYICAITSSLPHKNAQGIINAYKEYCKLTPQPLPLKIIGLSSVEDYTPGEIAHYITCVPFVKDDTEFYNIIQNSSQFLFLSLIEGFGFPPLEAMQLQIPVICSNRTSLPEVVSNAALLVDPQNPQEIANAILTLSENHSLCQSLIDAGKKNCNRFDWKTRIKLYMEVLAR